MSMIAELQPARIVVDQSRLAIVCRRYRVSELSLFGSFARGDRHEKSDIDLMVEFLPDAIVDLVDYADLREDLSTLFGRQVDLVSKKALKPRIRAAVLEEAQRLYAS